MLKLYNTLTRKKETFKPIKSPVRMYSCGPTVYSSPHIGNMRAYIFSDILKRVLLYNKYKVLQIMNVTDVGHLTGESEGEDKIELAAQKENIKAREITEKYLKEFKEDMKKLNILFPDKLPKASEHIKEQIEMIQTLEKKGFTYLTNDGVYFDSSKFKNYGKLANLKIESLEAGKRIAFGDKKNATDFALWKFSHTKRQQQWESPWGIGFPGWHIECSAMSIKYLGKTFDIHTGGEDHIPVHHTNEIAQSECATGKKFVNYWLHNAFLTFKGEKVSKSKGGLYTITELEELNFKPEHFRYLALLTHYKKPLDFTLEHLEASKNAFERIKRKIVETKENQKKGKDKTEIYKKQFEEAINNDLNTPEAIQIFIKALDDSEFSSIKKLKLLEKFDTVLALGIKDFKKEEAIPKEIKDLVKERNIAREIRDWKKADSIRNKIHSLGYTIEDKDNETIIRKN